MPWNQPGDNRDPWSGKQSKGSEIDNILKKITGGANKGGGGTGSQLPGILKYWPLLLLALWLLSGFFIVVEGNRGLVLRFGEFQSVRESGLGWHLPWPIEEVEIVDVDSMRDYVHNTTMLTTDENIVDIKIATQYRINDAAAYQFKVKDPVVTLQQAVESALRETVGKSTMDFVLTDGRTEIAGETKRITQQILDNYQVGIEVVTVNLQETQPPQAVKQSFDDVIEAREDRERYKNQAEAYENSVLPQAKAEAAQELERARAYKEQIIATATGDADRFAQLMREYQKAPEVTRERLYLETIEGVYGNSNKVLIDGDSNNSMMYLPLDKLINNSSSSLPRTTTSEASQPRSSSQSTQNMPLRESTRGRVQR